MKDRFVKVMLLVIAGLLLLNCFKGDGGGLSDVVGPTVGASVPKFVEEGKYYSCLIPSMDTPMDIKWHRQFKIEAVERESGWVRVRYYNDAKNEWAGYNWLNINQAVTCFQSEMPVPANGSSRPDDNSTR
ncbi:hypothetical protein [Persicitalea sp.]|uniref:hypothetical protein n=1 Tax=Persicitalea sp. TaxID=3100273 RepID=UPI003593967C